jgi:hypothetical protein
MNVSTSAFNTLALTSGELAVTALCCVWVVVFAEIRPVSGPTFRLMPNTDVAMSYARPLSMLLAFAEATAGTASADRVAPSTARRRTRTALFPRECVLLRDIDYPLL